VDEQANPKILMTTSMGDITLELDLAKAPLSTANFLSYAKSGHYDGTIFHRVIPSFMIQGGGFDAKMGQKPTAAPVANEAANGLKNDRGTIAMARTSDPHSATSQFFINLANNRSLNYQDKTVRGWGYTVFGRVTEGMEVVDAIAKVKTGQAGMHSDVPEIPVVIEKVVVV